MTAARSAERARALLEEAAAALPPAELAPLLVAVRWLAGAPHRPLHRDAARLFSHLGEEARAALPPVAAALAAAGGDPALAGLLDRQLDELAARRRRRALAGAA